MLLMLILHPSRRVWISWLSAQDAQASCQIKVPKHNLCFNINNMMKWNVCMQWIWWYFSYTLSSGCLKIAIRVCSSLVKIACAPTCACKNNRRIWRHNSSTSRSRDTTDQLWWRHYAESENTFLGNNDKMNDRWLFCRGIMYLKHKI